MYIILCNFGGGVLSGFLSKKKPGMNRVKGAMLQLST